MTARSHDDWVGITETVHRFALGIDTKDWALYRSIFTDDVLIDYSSYNGRPASSMRADDWVAMVTPLFEGLAATQHAMSNPIVAVDGDSASCTMYVQAAHALDHGDDDRWFTIGGYYVDTLRRDRDRWRIDGVTLRVLWRRGDATIMTTARRRTA